MEAHMNKLTLTIITIALTAVLTGCDKPAAGKKADIIIQPYTEAIPRTTTGKTERLFVVKRTAPATSRP